jgi:hypothetical protein
MGHVTDESLGHVTGRVEKELYSVLWSRSRMEPELLAGAGAGMSKFRLRLPALVPGQLN